MAEVLRCPACGAADTSLAGPDGVHHCVFCGVRYTHGTPQPSPPPPKTIVVRPILSKRARLAAVATGIVVSVFMIVSGRWDPAEREPRPTVNADVPLPTPVSVTVEAPPPEPPATATFVEHGILGRNTGNYYVLGVVTNTSPWPIERPKFDVVLKDASGAEVGVDNGFADGDGLAPGASQPVSLLVYQPPPHASHEVVVRPARATYIPKPATGLTVTPFPPAADKYGNWTVSGSVTNGGGAPARFVEVQIAAWDAADKLVGLAHTYAAGEEGLPAGQVGRYNTRIDVAAEPKRFTVEVRGRE